MKIDNIIKEIYEDVKGLDDKGKIADYIPELKKANIDDLAIGVYGLDGSENIIGSSESKFTLQSVSKVLSLTLAIMDNGYDKVLEKVDIKPTTDGFNQFYKLDLEGNVKASNPMINLGAISTTALIKGENDEKINRLMDFIREITNNPKIHYNDDVYISEKKTGFRNKSMAYMLTEIGNIEEPDMVLDNYFKQCSIEIDIEDLGKIAYFFASHGKKYDDQKEIVSPDIIRFVNAVMTTSGMYNYSGEYAANVGIPSKSGVSGCIMGAVPNRMGIAVYSPGLDEYGNSLLGNMVMKELSEKMKLSIF